MAEVLLLSAEALELLSGEDHGDWLAAAREFHVHAGGGLVDDGREFRTCLGNRVS